MKKEYRAVRSFHDSQAGKRVRAGDSLNLTEQRAADLLRNGLVEPAPAKAADPSTGSKGKAAPAKGTDKGGAGDAGQPASGK